MPNTISRKELIRKFRLLGFDGPYSGTKHQFMISGKLKIRIPNPHGAGDIDTSILKEILRQASIEIATWNNL